MENLTVFVYLVVVVGEGQIMRKATSTADVSLCECVQGAWLKETKNLSIRRTTSGRGLQLSADSKFFF